MKKCPNCKKPPVFEPSDDEDWPVMLAHRGGAGGCLSPYTYVIYHNTEEEAEARWNEHLAGLRR